MFHRMTVRIIYKKICKPCTCIINKNSALFFSVFLFENVKSSLFIAQVCWTTSLACFDVSKRNAENCLYLKHSTPALGSVEYQWVPGASGREIRLSMAQDGNYESVKSSSVLNIDSLNEDELFMESVFITKSFCLNSIFSLSISFFNFQCSVSIRSFS